MAAIVVNVMKKKRSHKFGEDTVGVGAAREFVTPPLLNHGFNDRALLMGNNHPGLVNRPSANILKRMASARMPSKRLSKADYAARTIQRNFRGYLLRQDMKGLVTENNLSDRSIVRALEVIARWHLGWNRFFVQGFVGILLIITVYFQVFYQRPSGYEVNTALLNRLEEKDFTSDIVEPVDVFVFLNAIVEEFYDSQVVDTPFCASILSQYCAANTNANDTELERIILSTCTKVKTDEAGADLDYIDHTNRLVGASFVVQTRKLPVPCATIFDRLDLTITGVDNIKRKKRHQCLSEVDEDPQFRVNAGCAQENCKVNNTDAEFILQPSPGNNYLFPLHVGGNRGLPFKAIQCRIDRMQRQGWMDYRTKHVCLIMGTYNTQGEGRMLSYRECFSFLNGGKVENTRAIASNSLYADATSALVMTWIMIVFIVVRQSAAIALFLQDRRAGLKRTRLSAPVTFHNMIGFMPAVLILSGCVIFLIIVYTISKMGTDAKGVENADITLQDFIGTLTQADWAVDLWVAYTTVVSIAMIIMLIQTLTLLDFHPTSAIVSGTLKRASGSLWCFALIFSMVILGYAFVGMILLGRTRWEFSSFGRAVNTLLFTAVGEHQRMENIIFYTKVDHEYVTIVQALYFWSYVLLVSILLMNLLLSIIVGSFVELQEKQEKTLDSRPILSFGRSLLTSMQFWYRGARVYARRYSKRVVDCCRRHSNGGGAGPGDADEKIKEPSFKVEDEMYTPWEQLIQFPKQYYHAGWQGFESASEARKKLEIIFRNEHTAELIISWCRAHSRMEKLQRYGHHLRGLDPDSEALKGHTVFMLESIMKRMVSGTSTSNFRSNKSVTSAGSIKNDQYIGEELEFEAAQASVRLESSRRDDRLQTASFAKPFVIPGAPGVVVPSSPEPTKLEEENEKKIGEDIV